MVVAEGAVTGVYAVSMADPAEEVLWAGVVVAVADLAGEVHIAVLLGLGCDQQRFLVLGHCYGWGEGCNCRACSFGGIRCGLRRHVWAEAVLFGAVFEGSSCFVAVMFWENLQIACTAEAGYY